MTKDKVKTKTIAISEYQIKYLLGIIKADIDYAHKKKFPTSEEVDKLYEMIIELC